jgi:hypothetical protein
MVAVIHFGTSEQAWIIIRVIIAAESVKSIPRQARAGPAGDTVRRAQSQRRPARARPGAGAAATQD